MFKNFDDFIGDGKAISGTLVVAAAHDRNTLEAVHAAWQEFGLKFVLVGDRGKIISFSTEMGFSPDPDMIVDADDDDCAGISARLIKEGAGDALMKGFLDTGALLKAVLDKENGIRGSGTLSHLALLEPPGYKKMIGITDGGMVPSPTLEQKAQIAINAADYYRRIGYGLPKIAALCASETVNEKIQETVDAAELQAMCRRGDLGDCLLEGPLSFDIAVSSESAAKKGIAGEVSGDADILLVPNITVGNVLAKGLIYWASAKMAGCVLGAEIPIVLPSRGASAEEKLLSIVMSLKS